MAAQPDAHGRNQGSHPSGYFSSASRPTAATATRTDRIEPPNRVDVMADMLASRPESEPQALRGGEPEALRRKRIQWTGSTTSAAATGRSVWPRSVRRTMAVSSR